jgi:hypothetical protein
MTGKLRVEAVNRGFWEVLVRAAFSNPFSQERRDLDRKIVGKVGDPYSLEHAERLRRAVSARVEPLAQVGRADFRCYLGPDRELMRVAFLFEAYHECRLGFDELVTTQVEQGDRPVPVPFAGEALALLERRGFDRREATRYLAIFYQLRRAFYFIVRGLVGDSPCVAELRRHLWNNIFTRDVGLYERHLWNRMEDFSTLLLGETGTGKGAAAAAIGRSAFIPFDEHRGCFAESFARNFIALNLAQFPETLIESELFGHRKGAFTGAVESHQGLLARCSPHGAIFLDEIGDVSIPIQIKLLHVLQARTFSPVGSHEQTQFRGRVIAATNRPLDALRQEGLFREDFFYRLCSDVIEVPPLRQRLREDPGELERLAAHILAATVGKRGQELTDGIVTTLRRNVGKNYRWPGNVRELEQAVRRVLLTGAYQPRRPDAADPGRPAWLAEAQAGRLDADGVIAGYCRQLHTELGSYEAVAGRTRLDRRTVRKYVHLHQTRADAGAVPNPEILDSRESPGPRPEPRD